MHQLDQLKKMLFIVNPVSGKRAILKYLAEIMQMFFQRGYLVTSMVTARRGDATGYARDLGGEYDLIVCTGGDGTLNEVVTGLLKGGVSTPVGYIPCGSTNDFASCHGLSPDIIQAASDILNGGVTRYDVGKFGDSYFNYIAAFGAFSWLSYTTPQNLKNVLGHSAYLLDAVKDLSKLKPQHLRVSSGVNAYEGDFIFGAVCSTTSVAGIFDLPEDLVDTADGLFEVLLIHSPPSIMEYQAIARALISKDFNSSPYVEFFQTKSLCIESDGEQMDWALDGEHAVCGRLVQIENLQQAMAIKH